MNAEASKTLWFCPGSPGRPEEALRFKPEPPGSTATGPSSKFLKSCAIGLLLPTSVCTGRGGKRAHQGLWSGWLQARRLPKGKSQSPTQLLGRGNLWLVAEPGGRLKRSPRSREAEPSRAGGIRKSSLLLWYFLMPCAKCLTQEASEGWLTVQTPVCWEGWCPLRQGADQLV